MPKSKTIQWILIIVMSSGLAARIYVVFRYGDLLTLDSDDLNYVKSAVHLLRSGIFTYQNYNEPTVYIMPLYPMFLAAVLKVLGFGYWGLQSIRIMQAVISMLTVFIVFKLAGRLFDYSTAVLAAIMVTFYLPNITTAGYILTETIFTFLLCLLVYLTLRFIDCPSVIKFAVLGMICGLITMCRPTIAFYPLLIFPYMLAIYKNKVKQAVKLWAVCFLAFCMVMSPWWVRNYIEYSLFIPLSASSGNPMLQGTYIDYKQTPENITYYKLGRNALETDRNEVEAAKLRIVRGFKEDFWGYLKWYTMGKTLYFWRTIFYWKELLGISQYQVLALHYILLTGFIGILVLLANRKYNCLFPVLIIAYFNAVHCIVMAFDRYAFPVMPLLTVFSAYFINYIHRNLLRLSGNKIKYADY